MTSDERIQKILDDPCTSYWLKRVLREALARDPVDALVDVGALHKLLTHRSEELGLTYVLMHWQKDGTSQSMRFTQ